jgi:hypothetical protein
MDLNKLKERWNTIGYSLIIYFYILFTFWYIPLSLGRDDLTYNQFGIIKIKLFFISLILFISLIFIIFCIQYILRLTSFNINLFFISGLIFSVLAVSALIYSIILVQSSVAFDGRTIVGLPLHIPTQFLYSSVADATVFLFSIIITFIIFKNKLYFKFLYLILIFFIIGIFNSNKDDNSTSNFKRNEKLLIGKGENVFFFVMDGFSGTVFSEIINTNIKIKEKLQNFDYYENAITKHPGTWASLGEITGGKKFSIESIQFNGFKPLKMAYEVAPLNTINFLKDNNIRSNYFQFNNNSGGQKNNVTLNYILISLYKITPYNIKEIIYSNGEWFKVPSFLENKYKKNNNYLGYIINETFLDPLKLDDNYYEDLAIDFPQIDYSDTSITNFNLIYFPIPHSPFVLDDNCKKIVELNNFDQYKKQSECSLNFVVKLIDKLKELKLYDDSRILVVSDHGWPNLPGSNFTDIQFDTAGGYQGRVTLSMISSLLLFKSKSSNNNINSNMKILSNQIYVQDSFKLLCFDKFMCPTEFDYQFQKTDTVYTTSTSIGTWDNNKFKIEKKYNINGNFRIKNNWTIVDEN